MKKKIDEDFGTIVVCAERYALGRQSYMPALVEDFVIRNMENIDDRSLGTIVRDIESAESMGYGLGDERIDKPGWLKLCHQIRVELERRKKDEGGAEA